MKQAFAFCNHVLAFVIILLMFMFFIVVIFVISKSFLINCDPLQYLPSEYDILGKNYNKSVPFLQKKKFSSSTALLPITLQLHYSLSSSTALLHITYSLCLFLFRSFFMNFLFLYLSFLFLSLSFSIFSSSFLLLISLPTLPYFGLRLAFNVKK